MGITQSHTIGNIIPHQRFTNSQFMSKQNVIIAHVNITKQSVVEQWAEDLSNFKKTNQMSSKFLLLPLAYQIEDSKFCTFNSSLKMKFQNFPYVLEEQINNRTNLNRNFEQEEMWLLFYSLLSAHNIFSQNKKKVGDIHPHNIFINQQGYPKVSCQLSWPEESTNFQKYYYQKTIRYLAPEQLYCCKQGLSTNQTDPLIAQSFSIGLTMLHAGLLKQFSPMYKSTSHQLSEQYLDANIDKWMKLKFNSQKNFSTSSYSPLLQNMIKNLCKINPTERQSAVSLYNTLKIYEDKILNLQPIPLDSDISENNLKKQNYASTIPFQATKINTFYEEPKNIPLNKNFSVKFNYKSNTDPNFILEDKRFITLGKNNNIQSAVIESQKELFMKYANLHHGDKIQNPAQSQKAEIKSSQIKQVFNYYADSHKHNCNSSHGSDPFAWNNNQYLGNFENKMSETYSNYPENNNLNAGRFNDSLTTKKQIEKVNQTKLENATDILKRIDEQILKSKSEFR